MQMFKIYNTVSIEESYCNLVENLHYHTKAHMGKTQFFSPWILQLSQQHLSTILCTFSKMDRWIVIL